MKTLRISTLAALLVVMSTLSLEAASDTAQEVMTMVEKAAKLVETKGEAAFEELRTLRFLDGEGYVVVSDMHQICLLNPIAESFEGKDMTTLQDATGVFFVTEMTTKAQTQDTGWISYTWIHPSTQKTAPKCLYYQKATMPDGRTVLVQAGFYGTDCQ